jgi:phosphate transport system permease protein
VSVVASEGSRKGPTKFSSIAEVSKGSGLNGRVGASGAFSVEAKVSDRGIERLTSPALSQKRRALEAFVAALCMAAIFLGLGFLGVLLLDIARDGIGQLSRSFIRGLPSRDPAQAGIWPALVGSTYVIAIVVAIALPVGVCAGIYLEEFARKGRISRLIEVNIQNLAAVPSIVYGLLAAGVFVKTLRLGESVLTGGLTLGLLVMPLVVVVAREAISGVPDSLRQAAYAMGATRWQVTWRVVLPVAARGILTGLLLAISRAIGEAAPLVTIGALTYVTFVPKGLGDRFTVLPIQIFNWISRPQEGFHKRAAGAIVVLLAVLLAINSVAIYLRARAQRRHEGL